MKCFGEKKRNTGRGVFARRKNAAGFTLVETLLAVALLSLMIVLPLSIASRGLSKITTGKDRFIAISLAREGIEYARNAVDRNRIYNMNNPNNQRNWLYGLNSADVSEGYVGCLSGINPCRFVDPLRTNANNYDIFNYGVDKMTVSPTTGLYGMKTTAACSANNSECWTTTKYTRRVYIEEIFTGREARVTAYVTWKSPVAAQDKKVVINEQLLNW